MGLNLLKSFTGVQKKITRGKSMRFQNYRCQKLKSNRWSARQTTWPETRQ